MPGQRGSRRRTTSALTRALGAAYFASTASTALAFLYPGSQSRALQRLCYPGTARCLCVGRGSSGSKQDSTSHGLRTLVMASPLMDLPTSQVLDAGASAPTLIPKRLTPLPETEERALLAKVYQAQILRRLGAELTAQLDGRAVSSETWAREAGLDVLELQAMLREGAEAKQMLVERNMPMVLKIVEQQYRWRLRGGQLSTADLVQEGAYALGVAADRYNPVNTNRFLTYAVFVIRDKLDTAIAHGDMAISVPLSALKEFYTARRVLAAELGRIPSDIELERYFVDGVLDVSPAVPPVEMSAGVKIDATKYSATESCSRNGAESRRTLDPAAKRMRRRRSNLMSAVRRVTSLDSVVRGAEGGPTSLIDTIAAVGADPLRRADNGTISSLLSKVLTPREAKLVRMASGLTDGRQRTMAECADELCLSVARTKALFATSLEKMRLVMAGDSAGPM